MYSMTIGTNDLWNQDRDSILSNLTNILEQLKKSGVIPIAVTIPEHSGVCNFPPSSLLYIHISHPLVTQLIVQSF